MKSFKLRKGFDLPIAGSADAKTIDHSLPSATTAVRTVAILGADYVGLKPRLSVEEGDVVACGAPILTHKDQPDVKVTAPVSGRIKAVNRGARRVLLSVEIEVDSSAADPVDFSKMGSADSKGGLVEKLCQSGLWTSFRTRPYSKIPDPTSDAQAIFVTAIDSEPLSPDPRPIIEAEAEAFKAGLKAIARLTDGTTYLCQDGGEALPGSDLPEVSVAGFSGPHPVGLPGTHVHFLEPPRPNQAVWTIWYQDVIAIGRLLITGMLDTSRTIAIAGPMCKAPKLVRAAFGASMIELLSGQSVGGADERMISGSVLSGRMGSGVDAYLGRYARQITLIEEDKKQIPLGWIRPMGSKFAIQPVLASAFAKGLHKFTSNLNGGRRAMVPTGTFETLMPQDYLPTQLLRSLLVMDTDQAQALGALELDEEDLGLAGFACPAKYEYGLALRDCLTKIEKDG